MDAFHSFWSKPGRVKNWDKISFPDYELLTMMLSALKWRERSGPIRMITDTPGRAFFERAGLLGLWDGVTCELDDVPESVDPYLFWAAGKLYALRVMPCPCVMLDTDLVVWRTLEFPPDIDVMAAHREGLDPEVYPDPAQFRLKSGYAFPADWDFSLDAANTAFLYLKDGKFRDYYTDCALSFMSGVEIDGLDPTTAMCFAEQRVLPMCAAAKGRRLECLFGLDDADRQETVTHIWGYKYMLKDSPERLAAFCVRCVRRLLRDFPDWAPVLAAHETLSKYLDAALEL